MRRRPWPRLLPPLFAAAALAAWALPGSAAVTSPSAHSRTSRTAAHSLTGRTAASADNCNPFASSLAPTGPPQVTAGSYAAKIRARGYLIAGVDNTDYHWGFLNPLDGKEEGFDIDIVHAIAKAIFGNPNKVVYKTITDAQRIPEVQSGAVDLVAHTMTITCARLQEVDFSSVYYDAGQRILVQDNANVTSIADLRGQKVCTSAGTTAIPTLQAAHARLVLVSNLIDCMPLLQQYDITGMVTDDAILASFMAQDPWVKMVGPRLTSEPYGVAISQQHPDFEQFVNAVLEQFRTDGQWTASYARWLGTPVPTPQPPQYKS